MIWEFYKFEKEHGKKVIGIEPQLNGQGRFWIFQNNPKRQRVCKCKGCGTKIPREVPRIKFKAAFYYGSGHYCLSCGVRELKRFHERLERIVSKVEDQMTNAEELIELTKKVMTDEFYEQKMALGRLCQVIAGDE